MPLNPSNPVYSEGTIVRCSPPNSTRLEGRLEDIVIRVEQGNLMCESVDLTFKERWTRRHFALWLGLGWYSLPTKRNLQAFEDPAFMVEESRPTPEGAPIHWSSTENETWRWFEREVLVNGIWELSGVTTPINKVTGEVYQGSSGYLDTELVPIALRLSVALPKQVASSHTIPQAPRSQRSVYMEEAPGRPSDERKKRHGRPPSRWLRSLNTQELEHWLGTVEAPEAGVVGMTYWTHLTRDHHFNPRQLQGLDEQAQAKLHAVAHYGY